MGIGWRGTCPPIPRFTEVKFGLSVDHNLVHVRTWGDCGEDLLLEILQVAVMSEQWRSDLPLIVDDRSPDRGGSAGDVPRVITLAGILDRAPGNGRAALIVRPPEVTRTGWRTTMNSRRVFRRTRIFYSQVDACDWAFSNSGR